MHPNSRINGQLRQMMDSQYFALCKWAFMQAEAMLSAGGCSRVRAASGAR